jgi:hypothetical protein
VEIERKVYKELRDFFLDIATHRSVKNLAVGFYQVPFEPYAPVRRQLLLLLREVNRARKRAGFALIPSEVLPLRRRVVRPFEVECRGRAVEKKAISQTDHIACGGKFVERSFGP